MIGRPEARPAEDEESWATVQLDSAGAFLYLLLAAAMVLAVVLGGGGLL